LAARVRQQDGTARVWDAATGACCSLLLGHTGAVSAVRWLAAGLGDAWWVVTASASDGSVRVWDAKEDARAAADASRSGLGVPRKKWAHALWSSDGSGVSGLACHVMPHDRQSGGGSAAVRISAGYKSGAVVVAEVSLL
jgi:WD40 repeat protein